MPPTPPLCIACQGWGEIGTMDADREPVFAKCQACDGTGHAPTTAPVLTPPTPEAQDAELRKTRARLAELERRVLNLERAAADAAQRLAPLEARLRPTTHDPFRGL